jgi:Leucine-rich repeat (LRR) protein
MLSQDQEKKATIKKKFSFSPSSSSAQRKRTSISSSKHYKQENKQASETSDDSFELYSKPLEPEFYINITTDGLRHMDYICHLNDDQVQNRTIERQLRPISGVKNRLKRNAHVYDEKLIEQSDLVKTLSKIQTIKRLDMSFNELSYYPKPLCDLLALETLNLANNKLKDSELPVDFDKYQNLIEIILDSNLFKAVPKSLINFKKLNRLSIRNNMISDFKNIENLHKLHYLVADNNEISRIDETFSNIDKLELLHLKGNSISYIHPSLLKKNFNQLKQLNLSYNKLQHVPVELLKLPRIEILNLGMIILYFYLLIKLNFYNLFLRK